MKRFSTRSSRLRKKSFVNSQRESVRIREMLSPATEDEDEVWEEKLSDTYPCGCCKCCGHHDLCEF